MVKKFFTPVVLVIFTNIMYGANVTDKSGTTAFAFLKIGQGARASAMADCYVGLSDDVNAVYWNPAGISQISSHELITNYTMWFEAISRCYIGYVHPKFKFGTLGCNINYLSTTIEKRTGETDDTYNSTTVGNMALSIVWGKEFSNKLSLGSGIKLIFEGLDTQSIGGIAIDLGGLYRINEKFSAGLSIQNIGTEMGVSRNPDPLPILLRAGVSKKLVQDKLMLLSDFYLGLVDMTASVSIGGEYKVSKVFYPRIGYKYRITNSNLDVLAGLSAGFGLKYKIYQFDYAFVPYGDLGFTHRLDFLIKF